MKSAQTIHSWYAIRVRSKFERAVSAALSGKGYDEYLPLYRSRRRWSDRSKDLDFLSSPDICSAALMFRSDFRS